MWRGRARLSLVLAIGAGLVTTSGFAWTLGGSGISGWDTRELIIHYNPTGCPLPAGTLEATLDKAIAVWNQIPTAGITLSRAEKPSSTTAEELFSNTATDSPVVICDPDFATHAKANPDGVPAATQIRVLDPSHDNIDYGGTALNAEQGTRAEISRLTSDQLTVALAHELGHILGLGHSGLPQALMYYSLDGKSGPELNQDDKDGLSYLYPQNDFADGPFGCQAVHPRGSPASLGWLFAFVLVQVVVGRRWWGRP